MTSQAPKAAQGLLRDDIKLVIAPSLEWAVDHATQWGWDPKWVYVRGPEDLNGWSATELWQLYPENGVMPSRHCEALNLWRFRGGKVLYPDVEIARLFEDIACSFERSLRERSHHHQ